MNNNQQIVGDNPQTGDPIYGTNNVNNQLQFSNKRYATFGERFGAVLSDFFRNWLVGFLISFLVIFIIFFLRLNGIIDISLSSLSFLGSLYIVFGQPIYALFGDASKKHASKGKLKRNMYVLDKNGNYLTFGQSFLRMLLKYVTLWIPFGLIMSIVVMCCTEKKQALHDLILGHVVVKNI